MENEVTVPPIGESITEGVLVEWVRKDGEFVRADEALFVLETDKVTMTINAAASGRLRITVVEGETVRVGQVVGAIDAEAGPSRHASPPPPRQAFEEPTPPREEVPQTPGLPMTAPAGLPQATAKAVEQANRGEFSPAVRRMVEEFRVDPSAVKGSGKAGRITKGDVLEHLRRGPGPKEVSAGEPEDPGAEKPAGASAGLPSGASQESVDRPQTRTRMSPIRLRIAERLVMAKNSAAILTTFNEADMTTVLSWRKRHGEAFQEKHGVKLGLMSFFIKASVEALRAVPQLNAQIQGDEIVRNHYYDIGFAVGTERGLMVPVIRGADRLSFGEIEREILRLAERARNRSITLAEITGGVFSVSNGGVYGNLLSTPILNPPQSGILGMHVIQKRPVVVDDEIRIRPMMYLALSYDHRLVDGQEAVAFLKRVKECVEAPELMIWEM